MRLKVTLSKVDCKRRLRDRMDSFFMFGEERYVGWCGLSFFSLQYIGAHKAYDRRIGIRHKALGYMKSTAEGTEITYFIFKGLTDPISILKVGFIYFVILCLAARAESLNFGFNAFLSLICALVIGGLSYLVGIGSEDGKAGISHLNWFIENTLKM